MAPRVVRISVAPVKALGLVHPDEVTLEEGGVVGDRRFWLLDEQGVLFNAKREGALLAVRPEWDEAAGKLALTFPDGRRVEDVVALGEPVDAQMYRVPRPSRQVIGPWQEALSEYAGRPLSLLWADEGAVDRTPEGGCVSLISRASLDRLREELGAREPVDGRRFRMLFEIDGVGPHEEDEWIGGEVRIGEASVVFNGDIGRCIVTSRDPDTGVADLPTLAALVGYRSEGRTEPLPCGLYGAVATPGRVRVGDPVSVEHMATLETRGPA